MNDIRLQAAGLTAPLRQHALTLVEVLVSLIIASLLVIPLLRWQNAQIRLHRQADAVSSALRDITTTQHILLQDLAAAIPPGPTGARFRVIDQHSLTLITASLLPGSPRGFRTVTWRWSAVNGVERWDDETPRWMTARVQLSFVQSADSESPEWRSQSIPLGYDGQALGSAVVLALPP